VHDCGLAGPELSIREIDTIFIAVNYGGKHSKLNPRLSVVRARSASLCCAVLSGLTPSPPHSLAISRPHASPPPSLTPSLPRCFARCSLLACACSSGVCVGVTTSVHVVSSCRSVATSSWRP
jgi:hypothetical protein